MNLIPTTTYDEACDNAQANFERTNGAVVGGTYIVKMWGMTKVVELRVNESGTARLVEARDVTDADLEAIGVR